MNNRTLWTIVGVVLLVVIGLLVFGVIAIPTTSAPANNNSNNGTQTSTTAALSREAHVAYFEQSAPTYSYEMAA